jgi:Zn-finger nucleic acid-binding protein
MTVSVPAVSVPCPRCGQTLGGRAIRGVGLEACGSCNALLVKQSALMPALEALSADILESVDPDAPLLALPDRAEQTACPGCGAAMEKADYCGARLVFFERCNRCALLWIGSEELGAMSLMWARMEKRIARTRAQTEENLAGMTALVDAAHLRRVVDNSLRSPSFVSESLALLDTFRSSTG